MWLNLGKHKKILVAGPVRKPPPPYCKTLFCRLKKYNNFSICFSKDPEKSITRKTGANEHIFPIFSNKIHIFPFHIILHLFLFIKEKICLLRTDRSVNFGNGLKLVIYLREKMLFSFFHDFLINITKIFIFSRVSYKYLKITEKKLLVMLIYPPPPKKKN